MTLTVIECSWCGKQVQVEATTGGPRIPWDWQEAWSGDWHRLLCPECVAKGPREETGEGERS